MAITATDLTAYSDDDLARLRVAVQAEVDRRAVIASASQQISRINAQSLIARGVTPEGAWAQPTDASNAYPAGWVVTYSGKRWQSLIPANTTKPGDTADPQNYRWWRDMTVTTPPPGGGPAAWDGNGHAYAVGDLVTFNGTTYKCIQAHTSQPGWDPVTVPALWSPQVGGR